jgi:hypothetical protein
MATDGSRPNARKKVPHSKCFSLTEKLRVVMRCPTGEEIASVTRPTHAESIRAMIPAIAGCIETIHDEETVHRAADFAPAEVVEFVEKLSERMFLVLAEGFHELAIVTLHGGSPEFVSLANEGRVALGMSFAALETALGQPEDRHFDIARGREVVKLCYGKSVGARGGVSYGLEITMVNGSVDRIKGESSGRFDILLKVDDSRRASAFRVVRMVAGVDLAAAFRASSSSSTMRLELGLPRKAAVELAESLRRAGAEAELKLKR